MFSIPGIVSQAQLSYYDSLILNDSPLIYFPLHKKTQSQSQITGLWGYKNYANGFTFDSYTYSSFPDITAQPTIVKGTSQANIFNTNNVINIPKSLSSGLNMYENKSIECWVLYQDATTRDIVSDVYAIGLTVQFRLGISLTGINALSGRFNFVKYFSGSTWQILNNSTPLVIGRVYHIAVTWTSTNVKMYLNGQLDLDSTMPGGMFSKPAGNIFIGRGHYPDGDPAISSAVYNRAISSFAIYDRILTPSEISNHYNAGVIS
jgi:hypothetical protein